MPKPIKSTVLLVFILSYVLAPSLVFAETKTVVFIRYRIAPNYWSTVVNGFKETMTQRGFVEGETIRYVDVLTRSADKSSVPDVLAAVQKWQGKADMIITCGWVSMYARSILKDTATPQLFVPILKSVGLSMLPSLTAVPGTNLSGVYVMYPPEKVLRLAHLVLPDLQRYGYVYDSRIPADAIFRLGYEKLTQAERHGITIHFFDLAQGVASVLAGLHDKKIEAYGGIVGSFKKQAELGASGLPVITAFTPDIETWDLEKYVRQGNILAGLYNPFRYCGVQGAEMTADIFTGKTRIKQTVPRPARQVAFINLKMAERFKIYIPFSALEAVDVVIK